MTRALPSPSISMAMSAVLPSLVPLKSILIVLPLWSTWPTKAPDFAASAFALALLRISDATGALAVVDELAAGVDTLVLPGPLVVAGVSDFEHAAAPRLIAIAPDTARTRVVMVFMVDEPPDLVGWPGVSAQTRLGAAAPTVHPNGRAGGRRGRTRSAGLTRGPTTPGPRATPARRTSCAVACPTGARTSYHRGD